MQHKWLRDGGMCEVLKTYNFNRFDSILLLASLRRLLQCAE
jgi:hypothetical protein